jgi:hypothetical protein
MQYKQNRDKVLDALADIPGKPVIAKKALKIVFPCRFRDIKLAVIGETSHVFGLFAILVDNDYALLNINTYVELGKASVNKVQFDGIDYYEYSYEPGDVVIRTKEVVARSALIFLAIDEFVFKGKVPWYVSYDDMGRLFETAERYSGTSAKILPEVMEFLAAYIARKKENRVKFIRDGATKKEDYAVDKISWVPLRSVYWSAPGTVNKVGGAYFADGVVSALVNPSSKVEKVESILRA